MKNQVQKKAAKQKPLIVGNFPAEQVLPPFQENFRFVKQIGQRKEIEKYIRASNALLKLLGRFFSREEYLQAVIKLIRGFSGCRSIGIRLINEEGYIPYAAHINYTREFLKAENWLSARDDKCFCPGVFNEKKISRKPGVLTIGNSLSCDNLSSFYDGLSEDDLSKLRSGCYKAGFKSIAVIPVTYRNSVIAALHLADERLGYFSPVVVELIERLAPFIGEGIFKFNLADNIWIKYNLEKTVNAIMRLSLEDVSLEKFLENTLDFLFHSPLFPLDCLASILLIDEDKPDTLVLKAQNKLSRRKAAGCKLVPLGRCVCGKAALSRKPQFFSNVDENHEISFEGMPDHGHYCVPLIFVDRLLGVLNLCLKAGNRRDLKKEEFINSIAETLSVIIQRKQTEKKLDTTNKLLEQVFFSTHFLIAYLDIDFNFVKVNQAYANKDGREGSFYEKKNFFELYPLEKYRQIFKNVIETGEAYLAYSQDFLFTQPEQGAYWDWSLQPVINSFYQVEGVVLSLVDVTERELSEQRLNKMQKELHEAKRLADIGVLAATVAHELRNPLGVIRTAAYNIKRKSPGPLLSGHLERIEHKVLESDQIISNLLFYARFKKPAFETVKIYDLLEECVSAGKLKFSGCKAKLERNYKSLRKYSIEADPLQLKELFNNLLNNAFEALVEHRGKIEITSACDSSRDEISITFEDNGVGIDPEDLKKITEPFFTRKARGTGLGLTVCDQVVKLHGGKMIINSILGRGSVFNVVLPLKKYINRKL